MKLNEILTERDTKQPRVGLGSAAQAAVRKHLESTYGKDFQFISSAGESQKSADLVANIHGVRTQFEIKGRDRPTAPIKIYEKSIGRGERDRVLDAFARSHTNGQAKTFTELVDLLRQENPAIGFPGDEGVTAKAGKFYLPADDSKTRTIVRRYLIDTLRKEDDDFFAIVTRNTEQIDIYDIGSTNKEIQVPKLPNIRVVRVETYGGSYKHRMRIAVKVIFSR